MLVNGAQTQNPLGLGTNRSSASIAGAVPFPKANKHETSVHRSWRTGEPPTILSRHLGTHVLLPGLVEREFNVFQM